MKASPNAHSAYVLKRKGEVIEYQETAACYYFIFYTSKKVDEVILYVGKNLQTEDASKYTNWYINDGPFAECFKTKSVKEGWKNGFQCNLDVGPYFFRAGLTAFRYPYERKIFSWVDFFSLGLSGLESLILAETLLVDGGYISKNYENSNHKVYSGKCPTYKLGFVLKKETGSYLKWDRPTYGTSYTRGSGRCWHKGLVREIKHIDCFWGDSYTENLIPFTKENAESILKNLGKE